jgi:hypothetical protein
MAEAKGWAKRLHAAQPVTVHVSTSIRYDERTRPRSLSLYVQQQQPDRYSLPSTLELVLDANEARTICDALVDFIARLEE